MSLFPSQPCGLHTQACLGEKDCLSSREPFAFTHTQLRLPKWNLGEDRWGGKGGGPHREEGRTRWRRQREEGTGGSSWFCPWVLSPEYPLLGWKRLIIAWIAWKDSRKYPLPTSFSWRFLLPLWNHNPDQNKTWARMSVWADSCVNPNSSSFSTQAYLWGKRAL